MFPTSSVGSPVDGRRKRQRYIFIPPIGPMPPAGAEGVSDTVMAKFAVRLLTVTLTL